MLTKMAGSPVRSTGARHIQVNAHEETIDVRGGQRQGGAQGMGRQDLQLKTI
jgi:hypothetical protein